MTLELEHSNNKKLDEPNDLVILASLRTLWHGRQASEKAQDGSKDDEEEEDYASETFWKQVETHIETASANHYSAGPPQKKKNKRGNKSYGLHTVLRLSNHLLRTTTSDDDNNLARALVQFGLWKYSQDATVRDVHGRLPLHIAVQGPPCRLQSANNVIAALLDLHPQAAECTDPNEQAQQHDSIDDDDDDDDDDEANEQYPLHTALQNGHSWYTGIQPLAENCPDALVLPHGTSSLYPYQMAAIENDLDTVYRLLWAQPGVLQSSERQEEDLGLLMLAMQEEGLNSQEREEVLLYLTSDDEESLPERRDPSELADEEAKIRAMQEGYGFENQSLDGSNHSKDSTDGSTDGDAQQRRPRRKRRGRRRSFVSFDDQAQILEQAAEVYQRRKENGFRDLGLLQHIDNCKETRAALRPVGDPEVLRKKKIADFIEEFRRTKPRGKNTHGLSEYEVRQRRAALRKVTSPRKNEADEEKSPCASPIAKMRSQLRSAEDPRPASPVKAGKKWTPKSAAAASNDNFGPVTPLNFMFGGASPKKKNLTDRLGARAQYTNVAIAPPPVNTADGESQKDAMQKAFCGTISSSKESGPAMEEEDIIEGPPSPMAIQRAKLRSVKKNKGADLSKPSMEKEQEDAPASPHQPLRQRLRPTQTKPRQYQSSIKNIASYERKPSTDSGDSTMSLSAGSLMEDAEMDGRAEENSRKCGETPSSEVVPPSSSNVISKVNTIFSVWGSQETKPHDDNLGASPQTIEVPTQSKQVDGTTTSSNPPIEVVETVAEVEENPARTRPSPKREPSRRRVISSDFVLRKRAEMELRDQVQKTHTRLRQYQERRMDTRDRHELVRRRKTLRLDKASTSLCRAQESVSSQAFDGSVYELAIVDATQEQQQTDLGPETQSVEADLIKHMHCMMALEKQESLLRQHLGKAVAYLRRCKKWLQDYDAVEGLMCDLEAQNGAMLAMYQSTDRQQTDLIEKYAGLM